MDSDPKNDERAELIHAERCSLVLGAIPCLFENPQVTILTGNAATDFWGALDANMLELHRFPCAEMPPDKKGEWVDALVKSFCDGRRADRDVVILTYDLELIELLVAGFEPRQLRVVRVSEHRGKFNVHVFAESMLSLEPHQGRLMWDPR